MFISISTNMKRDPRQYRWLEYLGRNVTLHVVGGDKEEYEVSLSKGEKIGIKNHRGFTYLVDGSDLSTQFRLDKEEAKRLIANSKGFSGKIGRYKVLPAVGGKDPEEVKKNRVDQKGRIRLTTDSSAFSELKYEPSTSSLYVKFKSGAVWQYADVSKKEALGFERAASQGRWFHKKILGLKPEAPLDSMPD